MELIQRMTPKNNKSKPQLQKGVLVFEEDKAFLSSIKSNLPSNYLVYAADNLDSFITICKKSNIDIALIDYQLNDLTNTHATELLDELGIPFLILSAGHKQFTGDHEVLKSAYGLICKPVDLQNLHLQIDVALARSADISHLHRCIRETNEINIAIGILMERKDLTREEARKQLQNICRPRRIRAIEAAELVVENRENLARTRTMLAEEEQNFDTLLNKPLSNKNGKDLSHA